MTVQDPVAAGLALQDPWDLVLAAAKTVLAGYTLVTSKVNGRIFVERRTAIQPEEVPAIVLSMDRESSSNLRSQAPKVYAVQAVLRVEGLVGGADSKAAKEARRIVRACQLALEANETLLGNVDRILRTAREVAIEPQGENVYTVAAAEFAVLYDEDAINEANRTLLQPLVEVSGKFLHAEDDEQVLVEALAEPEQI